MPDTHTMSSNPEKDALDALDDENMRNFVRVVTETDAHAIAYLRRFGIFVSGPVCPGRQGTVCGKRMVQQMRNSRPIWRCPDWRCQTRRSIRSANDFFGFVDNEGRYRVQVSLTDIITMVWLWVYSGMTLERAAKAAGVAKPTATAWFAKCRKVCTDSEMSLPKMHGTIDEPIQIDESYFAGRRKYNRGRLRVGDRRQPAERAARQEMEVDFANWGSVDPERESNESE